MKILFFIDGLRAGGKERQVVTLLKSLTAHKEFQVAVAVMNKDIHYKEIFELAIDIHYFVRKKGKGSQGDNGEKGDGDISVFRKFITLCREIRPDIIHAWDSLSSIFATPAARLLGIKIVNGSIRHAGRYRRFKKLWFVNKLAFPFSHRVVSNSMAGLTANDLAPSAKNRCIVNGFDLSRRNRIITGEKIRGTYSITTPRVVGMVAGFEDRKDYKTFIKAAQQITKEREDVTFIAVGDGKNFEQIKTMLSESDRERIKLVGRQRDVESIVNIFDIALLINNTAGHGEGISNSIMEYMALGKPVIATDSGGNRELVLDNETGYIIEPFAPETLSTRIGTLLDDNDKAAEMGRLGKQRIEQEFSLEQMVNNYISLYREFIK
ncbi:MAG: glycosyltransferase [bacterium]|nr:glycosyltransferase [bacterium]